MILLLIQSCTVIWTISSYLRFDISLINTDCDVQKDKHTQRKHEDNNKVKTKSIKWLEFRPERKRSYKRCHTSNVRPSSEASSLSHTSDGVFSCSGFRWRSVISHQHTATASPSSSLSSDSVWSQKRCSLRQVRRGDPSMDLRGGGGGDDVFIFLCLSSFSLIGLLSVFICSTSSSTGALWEIYGVPQLPKNKQTKKLHFYFSYFLTADWCWSSSSSLLSSSKPVSRLWKCDQSPAANCSAEKKSCALEVREVMMSARGHAHKLSFFLNLIFVTEQRKSASRYLFHSV